MKLTMKTTKIAATTVTVLFLVTLIFTGALVFQKQTLKRTVAMEQANATTLLAQKHALQKEIEAYTAEMKRLTGKNKELDASLSESLARLDNAQDELNRLMRDAKDKKQIEKKLLEVEALKNELNEKLSAMNAILDKLNDENLALNSALTALQSENREMAANMQMMQAVMANNFLIEALKGNKDKLTVSAKRTGKIKVDFEIPVAIQSQVHFKIIKPDGNIIDSKTDKNFTMFIQNPGVDMIASSSSETGMPMKTKKVNLTYKPKNKLRPGIYTIEVYNHDTYLGSSQIKLK